jgi:hypothetical protein
MRVFPHSEMEKLRVESAAYGRRGRARRASFFNFGFARTAA